jgi:nicotinic acid phosphoribosyltransferase
MNPLTSVLLTDLYPLTMLAGYLDCRMEATAVFELFVRKLPDCRNFPLVAGLEQALAFLERLHFTPEELDWIKRSVAQGRCIFKELLVANFCKINFVYSLSTRMLKS